jgi:serine protease Do
MVCSLNNHKAKRWFSLPAAVLVAAVALGHTALAAEPENVFASAIAHAQRRCVKIYGAGIGRVEGYATGLIVSADGQILTGQGVFLSGTNIRVVTPDGRMHYAKVLRRSTALQIALLKIESATPDFFEVPEKSPVAKGDWVLAVTNLFKVADRAEELSVSLGVVSLRTRLDARRGTQDVPYDGEVLITDAITSNPGAEGGALITIDGQLAGMVGKIIESKSTNTRLNYAVPADLLQKFLAGVATSTTSPKGKGGAKLGIRLFTLTGTKRAPAYIDRVLPNSPAAKAGLKKDDLILSIDKEIVHDIRGYGKLVKLLTPDEEITMLVKRKREILRILITPTGPKTDATKK